MLPLPVYGGNEVTIDFIELEVRKEENNVRFLVKIEGGWEMVEFKTLTIPTRLATC